MRIIPARLGRQCLAQNLTMKITTKTDMCINEELLSHEEWIECPACGDAQKATVEHTRPFHTYVHACACGHIITESEWQNIDVREHSLDEQL